MASSSKGEEQPLLRSGADVKPNYVVPRHGSIGNAADLGEVDGNGADVSARGGPSHGGFLSGLWPFGSGGGGGGGGGAGQATARRKMRKAPVKVEPKVFFANERTFLAWLNMSVTLASISVAILAFADHNEYSQIYGFILLPVAIAFVIYALRTYIRRSSMLRNRMPGPYEDRLGPVVLTVLLVLSILVNMSLKLVDIWSAPSPSPKPFSPASPVDSSSSSALPQAPVVSPVSGHGGKHHKAPGSG